MKINGYDIRSDCWDRSIQRKIEPSRAGDVEVDDETVDRYNRALAEWYEAADALGRALHEAGHRPYGVHVVGLMENWWLGWKDE